LFISALDSDSSFRILKKRGAPIIYTGRVYYGNAEHTHLGRHRHKI
jgi:hypothetical protein